MMIVYPHILKDTLSKITHLDSPQINAFNEKDNDAYPVHFSFRFMDYNIHSHIYLKLINSINEYSGKVIWIMHKNGSKKNYTIEPIDYYIIRKSKKINEVTGFKEIFGDKYFLINKMAIEDLYQLNNYLQKEINEYDI